MPSMSRYEEQRKVFDPNALMREAQAVAGLSDFGDMRFVEPMGRLLDRAAREMEFSPDGLKSYKADVVRFLVNRLRAEDDFRRHPEIMEEDISNPIIIVGLPRSGTTKLQRMMSAVQQVQKTFYWRLLNPAPFPDAVHGQPDPRITATGLDSITYDTDPKVQAAHAMALSGIEEEFVLFDLVLDESVTGWNTAIPLFNYKDWVPGKPDRQIDREAYQYVKKLLQYLQWQDGGKRSRPWILKAVIHVAHMDSLMECFPKATVIHCHRDPRASIPSIAKFMWAVWGTKVSAVDKKFVGREFLNWGATAMHRYLDARDRLQLDDRIIDAEYENIRDDIMPIICEAYARAGWKMSNEAEQSMLQWEQDNEQGKHGEHVYSLDEFGLSEEMIDHGFADYIDRFIDRKKGQRSLR